VCEGSQRIGTGFRAAVAMLVAEELGLQTRDVTPHVGDSRWPEGVGSGGSNTTNSVAPAVRLAAHDARAKLFAVAARLLGPTAGDLHAAVGKIFVAATPAKSIGFRQAAAKMPNEVISAVAER